MSDHSKKNDPVPVSEPPSIALAVGLPPEVLPGTGFGGVFNIQSILKRIRSLKGLLRLKPFDTATEEGRSRERYRRAALTTITSVIGRVVTVFTSLLTVRLTI